MRARLGLLDTTEIDWARAALRAEGLSHTEIVMACDQAAKNAILEHRTVVREAELVHAREERRDGHA